MMMVWRFRRLWVIVQSWLFRRLYPFAAINVSELPDKLNTRSLYLVGENEHLWFAAMLCPCGCGATLHLNMLSDTCPRWKLTEHRDGTVSLHPSVWRLKDCRSHFFLRRGRIDWCEDLLHFQFGAAESNSNIEAKLPS